MTEILFLASYHFRNSGHDIAQLEVADILSNEKQYEVDKVVQALSTFKPNKIAVEVLVEKNSQLNEKYGAYLKGNYILTANEIEQLGFKLAVQLKHNHLYAVDFMNEFPYQQLMDYAETYDRDFLGYFHKAIKALEVESSQQQRTLTVSQILRKHNDPKEIAYTHGLYMRIAKVGSGDNYVGVNLVAKWYERNLQIFSNLLGLSEPNDRILMIYGSGHAAILREFIQHMPDMRLVEANDYLPMS